MVSLYPSASRTLALATGTASDGSSCVLKSAFRSDPYPSRSLPDFLELPDPWGNRRGVPDDWVQAMRGGYQGPAYRAINGFLRMYEGDVIELARHERRWSSMMVADWARFMARHSQDMPNVASPSSRFYNDLLTGSGHGGLVLPSDFIGSLDRGLRPATRNIRASRIFSSSAIPGGPLDAIGMEFPDHGYTSSQLIPQGGYYDNGWSWSISGAMHRNTRAHLYIPQGAHIMIGSTSEDEVVIGRGAIWQILDAHESQKPDLFDFDMSLGLVGFENVAQAPSISRIRPLWGQEAIDLWEDAADLRARWGIPDFDEDGWPPDIEGSLSETMRRILGE